MYNWMDIAKKLLTTSSIKIRIWFHNIIPLSWDDCVITASLTHCGCFLFLTQTQKKRNRKDVEDRGEQEKKISPSFGWLLTSQNAIVYLVRKGFTLDISTYTHAQWEESCPVWGHKIWIISQVIWLSQPANSNNNFRERKSTIGKTEKSEANHPRPITLSKPERCLWKKASF